MTQGLVTTTQPIHLMSQHLGEHPKFWYGRAGLLNVTGAGFLWPGKAPISTATTSGERWMVFQTITWRLLRHFYLTAMKIQRFPSQEAVDHVRRQTQKT